MESVTKPCCGFPGLESPFKNSVWDFWIKVTARSILKSLCVWCMCLTEEPRGRSYSVGLWLKASKSESCPSETIWQCHQSLHWPRIAGLLLSPPAGCHPCPSKHGPPRLASGPGRVRRALVLGNGVHLERWPPPCPSLTARSWGTWC